MHGDCGLGRDRLPRQQHRTVREPGEQQNVRQHHVQQHHAPQRTGAKALFDQFRSVPYQRPTPRTLPERDLPVVLLLGSRGSGKSHLLRRLADSGKERPTALVRLPAIGDMKPRDIVAKLAGELCRPVPRLPRLYFPRLAIGLVTLALDALPLDARAAERQLRTALLKPRELDARVPGISELVETLIRVFFSTVPFLGAINSALRLAPLVPVPLTRWSPLTWYGNGGDPFSELRMLHDRSRSDFEEDQEHVEVTMIKAFLADLRAAYPRAYDTTRPAALLDDVDHPGGRYFLDLLAGIRAEDRTVADPLVVFGTASDSNAVPGPSSQDFERVQMRWSDEASFDNWFPLRGKPLDQTEWDFYCVRLRDLGPDVVEDMKPVVRGQLPDIPALVHGLTGGHAQGAALLLGAVAGEATARWTLTEVTRSLLRPPGGDPGPAPTGVTAEAALAHLMRDVFDDEQQAALTLWAAARDYPTAWDSGLLNSFSPEFRHGLPRALEPRLWVVDAEAQDAAARGGVRGPGGAGGPGAAAARGRVLHPWLRLLLLTRLADARPGTAHMPAGLDSWDSVHTYLQQKATDNRRTLDVQYHALAQEQVKPVVDHLAAGLIAQPVALDEWMRELYTITGAPLRYSTAGETASTRARTLAETTGFRPDSLKYALALLVSALCLAGDARNRIPVAGPHSLRNLIADGFTAVADRSGHGSLSVEAEKFN
ncbi:hypothetical protein [Streptomyces sp. IBSBF 3136]|uniref:hypothetical protein n=1 Tax=Streptomyces sp. IBSBF 3136 TaxID=2903524 RepID=UPI002FDC7755